MSTAPLGRFFYVVASSIYRYMNHYVLHGGSASDVATSSNESFFALMSLITGLDEVKIGVCTWARSHKDSERVYMRDSQLIMQSATKYLPVVIHISEESSLLDLDSLDVLYIVGGTYPKLLSVVETFGRLEVLKILESKTVFASSAGTFLLAKNAVSSFSWEGGEVYEGLGLLPISMLCHADIDPRLQQKIAFLTEQKPNQPIIALPETQWCLYTG